MERDYKAISLFSGAMGLDIGFEEAGIHVGACVEIEKNCVSTIRLNRPDIAVFDKDVREVSGKELLEAANVDRDNCVLIGGPPCQSFSAAGNRAGLNDSRGNLIFEYFRLVREIQPACFLFENVGNLLTSALVHRPIDKRPGRDWNLAKYSNKKHNGGCADFPPLTEDEQSGSAFKYLLNEIEELGYAITFRIVNAADYGAPQKRIRFLMVGFRDLSPMDFPEPSHGDFSDRPYVTLRDAIEDLIDEPGPHSIYTERIASYFRKIPEGGNWTALAEADQKEIMGGSFYAGGGKTGFMRRLAWDIPCPTLTTKANRKGTSLCHPDRDRPLSVREYSRIQGFPDDWQFSGAMNQQYQQIGNAVPIALGRAIAQAIREHLTEPDLKHRTQVPLEQMRLDAIVDLRSYARNNKSRPARQVQASLI